MIKKILFNAAALAAVCFAAVSCSSDEETILNGGETANVVTLAFNDGGDNMSRAARPVTSSAAANNVNKVKLLLFVQDGTNWVKPAGVTFNVDNAVVADGLLNWTPVLTEGVKGDIAANRDVIKNLTIKGLAASKKYRIVAYGYNDVLGATIKTEGQVLTATPKAGSPVEEIFSGYKEFNTDETGKIVEASTKVLLKRQVAGFLAYFKNIPYKVEGSKVVKGVRVIASASAPAFNFGAAKCAEKQNGTVTNAGNVTVFNQDLSEADFDEDKNIYTYTTHMEGVGVVENSILGGKFLIAFAGQAGKPTFTVELYDEKGNAIKSWPVKNGTDITYDVNRNQFYMLGKKYSSSKNPEDPENPDPEPDPEDDPIDLSKDSEIQIIVNDLWDVIHSLTI